MQCGLVPVVYLIPATSIVSIFLADGCLMYNAKATLATVPSTWGAPSSLVSFLLAVFHTS